MRRLLAVLFALAASAAHAGPAPGGLIATADFDYYVFTLSWSPGFCDTGGAQKAPEQCATPLGFVIHGLWPNSANGPDPGSCGLGPNFVPGPALAYGSQVYPTRSLALHEWRAHGTCTGLDPLHYFRAVQFARDEFKIPDALAHPTQPQHLAPSEIARQFQSANANLTAQNMAVTCQRGELVDVRFCLTKDLRAFAVCPKVARRSCSQEIISVSPLR